MTELVPASSSAAENHDDWLSRLRSEVADARSAIEKSDVPADVNEMRLRAAVIAGAAARSKAEELALAACEVQTRAERRLGQLRLAVPGAKGSDRGQKKQFDAELGLKYQTAWRYEQIGKFTDEEFEKALGFLVENKHRPSADAIFQRIIYGRPERVERGIFRLRDGRLMLKWKNHDRQYTRTLQSKNIEYARRELAFERGALKRDKITDPDLAEAYTLVRRALNILDSATDTSAPRARLPITEAISALLKAEEWIMDAQSEAGG